MQFQSTPCKIALAAPISSGPSTPRSAASPHNSQSSFSDTCTALRSLFDHLKSTNRGKHVGSFSYYHISLIRRIPKAASRLDTIRELHKDEHPPFNVIKLNRTHRISLLHYEPFTTPFPALLTVVSFDLHRGTTRVIDYTQRANPPLLHRKELLLSADDPIVPQARELTTRLETLGAFADTRSIGTRLGWHRRLTALGINPHEFPST